MASENVDLIRQGFEVFAREGLEGFVPLLDPEVEVIAEDQAFNSGTFHGVDGFTSWSQNWFDAWQEISYEAIDVIAISESVFVIPTLQRAKGAGSGIEVEQTIAWVLEILAGRVKRFHLYFDRDRAMRAAERIAGGG